MAIDLEADDAPGVVPEPVVADNPVSEAVAASEPKTPLEDLYDFDDPGAKPPEPAVAEVPAEVAPVVTATDAVPALSPALAQRAAQVGFGPEAISAIKDPIALEIAVRQAEQVATNVALAAQQHYKQQAATPAPVQQTQQLPPAPTPPPAFDEAGLRSQMTSQNYDETLQNHLVAQAKGIHAQAVQQHEIATQLWKHEQYNQQAFAYMQRKDAEVAQIRQQHQQELVNRYFEVFHGSLPEQHKALVSDQATKAQVYAMADAMAFGMSQRGQQVPSNVELFKMATNALLGEKLYGAAVDKVRQEVATHQGRAVARPSGGSGARAAERGGNPVDRAAAWAENFQRQLGITSTNDVQV